MEWLNQLIGNEGPITIGVTSEKLRDFLTGPDREVELLSSDLETKRYYNYIILDHPLDLKKVFRALRNGGYLLFTNFEVESNYLYDLGFSTISQVEGFTIVKKVHSWNDW
ncbi:MAG: hypothetical protein ABGW77_05405 [Campylobacterales bacterium]